MKRPDIIAHRGASRDYLENTLPAFAAALSQGANGIELDIHGSLDGALVVHHDANLVLANTVLPIQSLTRDELRALRLTDGSQVPFLDDVLSLVGKRATVYVEVKALGLENAVADMLNLFADVPSAVHSFRHQTPRRVRELRPSTPIGFLCDTPPKDLDTLLGQGGADTLWLATHLIDEAIVKAVHGLNRRLVAWTENDPHRARLLQSWGVDGLCTDVPAQLRAALV